MVLDKTYTFSFTGASALIAETLVIAEEYHRLNDWKAVEKSLFDNNLLNKVKQATFKRELLNSLLEDYNPNEDSEELDEISFFHC